MGPEKNPFFHVLVSLSHSTCASRKRECRFSHLNNILILLFGWRPFWFLMFCPKFAINLLLTIVSNLIFNSLLLFVPVECLIFKFCFCLVGELTTWCRRLVSNSQCPSSAVQTLRKIEIFIDILTKNDLFGIARILWVNVQMLPYRTTLLNFLFSFDYRDQNR